LIAKRGGVVHVQQLVFVQTGSFSVVSFSPNLRLKTYYFQARKKRTRKKKGALFQELAHLSLCCLLLTSLTLGQAQPCLAPKFGRTIGHKAFLGSFLPSYTYLQVKAGVREQGRVGGKADPGKALENDNKF
jgi:hypothetical protein